MLLKANKTRAIIVLLLAVSFVTVSLPENMTLKAESKTVVVPDDYSTIQEAINSANENDTVFVKIGVYHENVGLNKPIRLIGEDRDSTIIDGNPPEGYRVPINIKSNRVEVSGFTLSYGYAGIQIGGVKKCTISNNKITDTQFGAIVTNCTWCNVSDNIFESIGLGCAVQLNYAGNNLVKGNYIDSCVEGIQIRDYSYSNTVSGNTVVNCDDQAIRLLYSSGNNLTENSIANSGVGTSIYVSNSNTLYHNNFINNTVQVSANEWYAQQWGYSFSNNTIDQNYWSDYNGTDADGDGLGDTPYIIDENNHDNHPLIEQVDVAAIPEFLSWIILPLFMFATLAALTVKRKAFRPT